MICLYIVKLLKNKKEKSLVLGIFLIEEFGYGLNIISLILNLCELVCRQWCNFKSYEIVCSKVQCASAGFIWVSHIQTWLQDSTHAPIVACWYPLPDLIISGLSHFYNHDNTISLACLTQTLAQGWVFKYQNNETSQWWAL